VNFTLPMVSSSEAVVRQIASATIPATERGVTILTRVKSRLQSS